MGKRIENIPTANRWALTDEVKNEWLPKVKAFLEGRYHPACQGQCVDCNTVCSYMETNPFKKDEYRCTYDTYDLSVTSLVPYTLMQLVKELGYTNYELDENGWEQDFWMRFPQKDGDDFRLVIEAQGMTFSLSLIKEYY